MTKRECLLSSVFVGAPLVLAGRELSLPFGRMQALQVLDNIIFANDSKREQSEMQAVYECAWIMFLEKPDLLKVMAATDEENAKSFLAFAIEHEDELGDIKEGIINRLQALKAAMFAPDPPGKEDARHAS